MASRGRGGSGPSASDRAHLPSPWVPAPAVTPPNWAPGQARGPPGTAVAPVRPGAWLVLRGAAALRPDGSSHSTDCDSYRPPSSEAPMCSAPRSLCPMSKAHVLGSWWFQVRAPRCRPPRGCLCAWRLCGRPWAPGASRVHPTSWPATTCPRESCPLCPRGRLRAFPSPSLISGTGPRADWPGPPPPASSASNLNAGGSALFSVGRLEDHSLPDAKGNASKQSKKRARSCDLGHK